MEYKVISNRTNNFEIGEVVVVQDEINILGEDFLVVRSTNPETSVGSMFGKGTQVVEAHELETI